MDKYTDEELAELRKELRADGYSPSVTLSRMYARALRAERELLKWRGVDEAATTLEDALRSELAAAQKECAELRVDIRTTRATNADTIAQLNKAIARGDELRGSRDAAALQAQYCVDRLQHEGTRADDLQRRLDATVAALRELRDDFEDEGWEGALPRIDNALAAAQPQADAPHPWDAARERVFGQEADAPTPAEPDALPEGYEIRGQHAYLLMDSHPNERWAAGISDDGEFVKTRAWQPIGLVHALLAVPLRKSEDAFPKDWRWDDDTGYGPDGDEVWLEKAKVYIYNRDVDRCCSAPAAVLRALLSLPAPDESARVRELEGLLRDAHEAVGKIGDTFLWDRIDAALARKDGDE